MKMNLTANEAKEIYDEMRAKAITKGASTMDIFALCMSGMICEYEEVLAANKESVASMLLYLSQRIRQMTDSFANKSSTEPNNEKGWW